MTDESTRDLAGPPPDGAIEDDAVQIEVRIAEPKQLFNSIDPSPFREKDLDPAAENFIVGWARQAHRKAALSLLVHVGQPAAPDEAAQVAEAIHEFFRARAEATRAKLRLIFRYGRISLVIGIVAMGVSVALGSLVERWLSDENLASLVRESLIIGGWVAMWKPLETFLYDWWPILADARLFDRLGKMPIRFAETGGAPAGRER